MLAPQIFLENNCRQYVDQHFTILSVLHAAHRYQVVTNCWSNVGKLLPDVRYILTMFDKSDIVIYHHS